MDIYDCRENDTLERAVETMKKHKVSRLVVKDRADRVTGIISFSDVLWRSGDAEEVSAIVKQAIRTKVA